ncbi:hypothetical protein FB45DRAFT_897172 [Roridomyces roridus]|uniref:CBM1 domain-containing protein n=1 Tax=Roridomyces roridus TaxID=1738132 RepID=A0AAD7CB12_9AGAR|nr:hypothetical protein FB45DRAFT_897172 [Roridomyces roridus]
MALLTLLLAAIGVNAGTTVWSGNFNSYPNSASFDTWSFSNEVGEYQWYIHGTQNTSEYLSLSPSYKNPADSSETNGLKLTVDSTSTWNSQFERTELIPQTSANLGTGNLLYHFSISTGQAGSTNYPVTSIEHQICFFESHFTELKVGVAPNPTHLTWMVTEVDHWDTPWTPGVWYNFAYDIDFTAQTVGLWASNGSAPLVKVVQNVPAATSTNSADWHLGVLRINPTGTEDYFFSGVYIESAPITTSVGTGGGNTTTTTTGTGTTTSSASSTTSKTTTTTTTTTSIGPVQTEFGQCGGTGYTGATTCAAPYTCKAISPPYYYQCL